jgi:hypothetical protein
MKNHILLTVMFFGLTAGMLSCKKKKNDNPYGNQKITAVDLTRYGYTKHYRIVYDHNSNVDSIITTGSGQYGVKKFIYLGTSYSITDEYGNSFIVDADANGTIFKILQSDTLSMLYQGAGLAELDTKSPIASYPYYVLSSVYFTWSNGDVATVGAQTYDYTGRNGQPGDAIRIDEFLSYGRSYIKTNHLPADLRNTANDTAQKYFYLFDGGGRISQLTKLTKVSAGIYDTALYVYGY